MQKQDLQRGDIVQLNPKLVENIAFAGCFMVITEPKEWGAQGYIQDIGENREMQGDQAYYRAKWQEMELVGRAVWMVE